MEQFFSKFENFLFDILGLILPGLIFLGILILPLWLIDLSKIPTDYLNSSYVLSELSLINTSFLKYWNEKSSLIVLIIIISSYLIGHFIKVFSIIKYEILVALFDNSLNKLFSNVVLKIYKSLNYINRKFSSIDLHATSFGKWFNEIVKPIKNTLSKIFVFSPPPYFYDNDSLRTSCVAIINSRLATQYPDNWYSVYKFSTIINSQERIASLASFFLAKYNLYRSLAFNFLFATIYLQIFFSSTSEFIKPDVYKMSIIIIVASIFFWFTFHYKFKRYWTLCGNETLVSLYYFLNKKEISQ
ncbi:MAG: hypothetical protein ACO1OQ_08010 [Rufibacter sp.]